MPEKPVELIECGHLFDQDARTLARGGEDALPRMRRCAGLAAGSLPWSQLRCARTEARSRRDAAVERDDVVEKGRPLGERLSWRREEGHAARQTRRRETGATR